MNYGGVVAPYHCLLLLLLTACCLLLAAADDGVVGDAVDAIWPRPQSRVVQLCSRAASVQLGDN